MCRRDLDELHAMFQTYGGLAIPPIEAGGDVLATGNTQTDRLLKQLGLRHIWTRPYSGSNVSCTSAVRVTAAEEAVQPGDVSWEVDRSPTKAVDSNEIDIGDI